MFQNLFYFIFICFILFYLFIFTLFTVDIYSRCGWAFETLSQAFEAFDRALEGLREK